MERILGLVQVRARAVWGWGDVVQANVCAAGVVAGDPGGDLRVKGEDAFRRCVGGMAGTCIVPRASNLRARQKWLASGSITLGGLYIDKGAVRALGSGEVC